MRHTEVRAPDFGPALSSASSSDAVPTSPDVIAPPRRRAGLWIAIAASACAALGFAAWRVLATHATPLPPLPTPIALDPPKPPLTPPVIPTVTPPTVPVRPWRPTPGAPPGPKNPTKRELEPDEPRQPARRRGDVVKEVPF
jgi:hypothetical protein